MGVSNTSSAIMAASIKLVNFRTVLQRPVTLSRMMSNDTGRTEGAVGAAGDAFSKKEKAEEDQFFRRQQMEQLKKPKDAHKDEISHHEDEIKRHQDAIQRHKDKIDEMK